MTPSPNPRVLGSPVLPRISASVSILPPIDYGSVNAHINILRNRIHRIPTKSPELGETRFPIIMQKIKLTLVFQLKILP